MAVNVVDRLEAVEIEEADGERLAGLDPGGEQRLHPTPVRQRRQIVGIGDGGRGFFRLLRSPMLLRGEAARAHDIGESAIVLAQHENDKAGYHEQQRREPEGRSAAAQQCRDERRARGEDDEARGVREAGQTERAGGGRDPDAEQQESPFECVSPRHSGGDQGEGEGESGPGGRSASKVAPDGLEAERIDARADLQPIGGAVDRERQESAR